MSALEIQFTRRFSMGHRLLSNASPRCAIPHGHNEYVTVSIRQKKLSCLDGGRNMVANFSDIKGRWHNFIDTALDHALQLSETDPLVSWFAQNEPENHARIVVTPGDPTTELMAALLLAKLSAMLAVDHPALECQSLTLRETETNAVSLTGRPEDFLPPTERPQNDCWWWRPDNSISNLSHRR